MKKLIFVFGFVFLTEILFSQNLVINGGIDGYITCPGFGQFSSTYIISWDKPTVGSSDYYNYNCPTQPTVQPPHSGEGYAGIICYNFGTEYREYITGTFSSPLTTGTVYDVEFWVSLNDGYIQAIEEVDAYISVAAPGPFANALHLNLTPQIVNTNGALDDTANWKRVYGQYTASGGEQFITIGNFHDDAGTTITQPGSVGSFGAYYFIDDVSVRVDSTTSIGDIEETPDPWFNISGTQLTIADNAIPNQIKNPVFRCYDASGRQVLETEVVDGQTSINTQQLTPGLYIAELTLDNGLRKTGKFFQYKDTY